MATAIFECDVDNPDEVLEMMAEQQMRCKIRTAKQAESMLNTGAVRSEREAARVIAKETGEFENTVRQRIKRGKKAMGTSVPKKKTTKAQKQNSDVKKTKAFQEWESSLNERELILLERACIAENREQSLKVREYDLELKMIRFEQERLEFENEKIEFLFDNSFFRRSFQDPEMAKKVFNVGFRKLAMKYHPDHGGDSKKMKRLNSLKQDLDNNFFKKQTKKV